jgi:hypothetical protein
MEPVAYAEVGGLKMASENSPNRRDFLISAAVGTAAGVTSVVVETPSAFAQSGTAVPHDTGAESDLDGFLDLSRELTGEEQLDRGLGEQYLLRFQQKFPENVAQLKDLVAQYHSGKLAKALEDEKAWAVAEQIIYVWYLSAFFMPTSGSPAPTQSGSPPPNPPKRGTWVYGTLDQYEASLAWTVLGAHTPMERGGYMGHWADKPPKFS